MINRAKYFGAVFMMSLFLVACGKEDGENAEVSDNHTETASQETASNLELSESQEASKAEGTDNEIDESLWKIEYVEDENCYGNTAGNINNNSGTCAWNSQGILYFYNRYVDRTYMTDMADGISADMAEPLMCINFLDEKVYGVTQSENKIVVLDINECTTTVLREVPADYLHVVNDTMYFINLEDHTLRKMSVEGGEETILVNEAVYYPVIYKNQIIFQLDSDGESLYAIGLDGGEMTKLNDVCSYIPLVYHDQIYYKTVENEKGSLRIMNLDGSHDMLLADIEAYNINIYEDMLYYIDGETMTDICYVDLAADEFVIEKLELEEPLEQALRNTYGDEAIESFAVKNYIDMQFFGDYMIFFVQQEINGMEYTDQYLYNKATEEVIIIPEFCVNLEELMKMLEEMEEQETQEAQQASRSYPAGNYTVGSVYGPKLSQEKLDQVADAVQTFMNSYDFSTMDDYTKVSTAHDYLCNTCSYAADWSQNAANTAWGALVYHEAQCSGYARAMKALCDAMGVGCYYVHADENASNPSHQWNEVCVDGNWYIIDVQCNDSSGFRAFFLVSDATYSGQTGMSWNRENVPACPSDY